MKKIIGFLLLFSTVLQGQNELVLPFYQEFEFTQKDSLRGALRPERTCFDVLHYNLSVEVDIPTKSIKGSNIIRFNLLEPSNRIQLDLFENMIIDSILYKKTSCSFNRVHDAVFVDLPDLKPSTVHMIKVHYHGTPIAAKTPPWDGGFVWSEDSFGNPWIGVACEGIGASLWWPNKDHLSDEPDSMRFEIIVPKDLMAVANGNLIATNTLQEKTAYVWNIQYPINNYNVSLNIGNYLHFSDKYYSKEKGELACDYYVLEENIIKAKDHFKQVPGVLEAFEYYFGPYPFWEDGYALIETPYLGMEHQSGIAYGNQYNRGYMGGMIPKDMNWDYIIVHETGHEYWGNSVSAKDHADMWIHESFTTYMEALYVEFHHGREAVNRYLAGQKMHGNRQPLVGPYEVNFGDWYQSDHYFKGSWILHTLRSIIHDDQKWFGLLKALYQEFQFSTTNTEEITDFISSYLEMDLTHFYQQYLFHPKPPLLTIDLKQRGKDIVVGYRWDSPIQGFHMPIEIGNEADPIRLDCSLERNEIKIKNTEVFDFYINQKDYLIKTKVKRK